MSKPTYVLTRDVVIKAGTVVGEAPDKSERAVPFVSVLQGHGPNSTSEWVMPLDEALEQGLVVSQPQGDASGNRGLEATRALYALGWQWDDEQWIAPQVSGGGELWLEVLRVMRIIRTAHPDPATSFTELDALVSRMEAALSTPQARPDGGEIAYRWWGDYGWCYGERPPVHTRKFSPLFLHPAPAPEPFAWASPGTVKIVQNPDWGGGKIVRERTEESCVPVYLRPAPAPDVEKLDWIIRQLDAPERAAHSRYRGIEAIKQVAIRLRTQLTAAQQED